MQFLSLYELHFKQFVTRAQVQTLKIYRSRMSIEAMLSDCKTGGYNLEGSQANSLTSFRLLSFTPLPTSLTTLTTE